MSDLCPVCLAEIAEMVPADVMCPECAAWRCAGCMEEHECEEGLTPPPSMTDERAIKMWKSSARRRCGCAGNPNVTCARCCVMRALEALFEECEENR